MSKNLFDQIKNEILGSKYELSFSFITPKKIQGFNKIYRHINKPTDILSFPLSKLSGEIFICKSETKKMAPKFDRSYENFLVYLFIHGCVHLKGYDHGPKMEEMEEKFRRLFEV